MRQPPRWQRLAPQPRSEKRPSFIVRGRPPSQRQNMRREPEVVALDVAGSVVGGDGIRVPAGRSRGRGGALRQRPARVSGARSRYRVRMPAGFVLSTRRRRPPASRKRAVGCGSAVPTRTAPRFQSAARWQRGERRRAPASRRASHASAWPAKSPDRFVEATIMLAPGTCQRVARRHERAAPARRHGRTHVPPDSGWTSWADRRSTTDTSERTRGRAAALVRESGIRALLRWRDVSPRRSPRRAVHPAQNDKIVCAFAVPREYVLSYGFVWSALS